MSDMKVDDVSEGIELNPSEGKAMPSAEQEDHERAYFDSADWALGKVFREDMLRSPKGPLRHFGQSCSKNPVDLTIFSTVDGVNAASEGVNENNGDNNSGDQ
ncbi:hypothetical protein B296_00033788 [Ensete ventricosum]|uniref:Uncharacterized protein n=1 Tax=Ensete ventricosum TaxID=4639 RepID=A0A426ZCZ9_ENSVE|nr:hypothetical protein B296_00033788 [Ensete ventricosum]